ncbi:glucose-1-phosphate adenylyltransferase family protein [Planococcus sp. CAU13]|uniref:glucose-1-phosphate adenylyltransferase family protein n=1 Tax=Planococcus sp. CAU13 TaxID=1541197 RepID=UPI00052FF450|nr:sugar phosphate nucleotidyltransferase [Planococcus sp. CAU13]
MRLAAVIDATVTIPGLKELAMYRSSASIPFGGRYRLIDFALSNIVNSNLNSVGIFASQQSVSLMDHIGSGKSWDLDRRKNGLYFLPTSQREGDHLSVGSFEALEEHLNFFHKITQPYVMVTSTFCISQIDYNDMLEKHLASGADITEAVCDEACMKAYILSKELLMQMIKNFREERVVSVEDIVNLKKKPYTFAQYEYEGYFALINSMESYFNESQALLSKEVWLRLFLPDRPIYTKVKDEPPTKYMKGSDVKRSLVANGSLLKGQVTDSILSRAVSIGKNSKLEKCIIMQKCVIEEGCDLLYVIADKDVHIKAGSIIHGTKEKPVVIRKGSVVSEGDAV